MNVMHIRCNNFGESFAHLERYNRQTARRDNKNDLLACTRLIIIRSRTRARSIAVNDCCLNKNVILEKYPKTLKRIIIIK